jgi:hypothetical protein
MSKANGHRVETYDDNIVLVTKITELPYKYIPFDTFIGARFKHPDSTLYIYEGKAPVGYKIVAFPILLEKPKEEEADDQKIPVVD